MENSGVGLGPREDGEVLRVHCSSSEHREAVVFAVANKWNKPIPLEASEYDMAVHPAAVGATEALDHRLHHLWALGWACYNPGKEVKLFMWDDQCREYFGFLSRHHVRVRFDWGRWVPGRVPKGFPGRIIPRDPPQGREQHITMGNKVYLEYVRHISLKPGGDPASCPLSLPYDVRFVPGKIAFSCTIHVRCLQ